MKYAFFLVCLCFVYSCTTKPVSVACEERSDLFYEGLNDRIKKMTVRQTFDSSIVWDIERGYAYEISEMYYDENGIETKRAQSMYMDGKKYSERIYTVTGKNPRTFSSVNDQGDRSIDTIFWNGNTHRNVGYDIVDGKPQLAYETGREYDNDCMMIRITSQSYDWSTGKKEVKERTERDFAKDNEENRVAREKYGYAAIFHTHYEVIEWDKHHNPVKYLSKKPASKTVVEYEYYD